MKVVVTLALYASFEELRSAGGEVDIPREPLAEGLHLVTMYDDGSLSLPQHMLAVAVGDYVPGKWQVVQQWAIKSPVGRRDIITVEFVPDAIPLYLGDRGERVDVMAQQAAGLPICEVHSMYSPRCRCVYLKRDQQSLVEVAPHHDASPHN